MTTTQRRSKETVKSLVIKNKVIIFPYNKASKSAAALAERFHRKVTNRIMGTDSLGPLPIQGAGVVVVNWGRNNEFTWENRGARKVLNPSNVQCLATNKLTFFNKIMEYNRSISSGLGEVNIPEFTDDRSVAIEWLAGGSEVLGRSVTGLGGKDIVFLRDDPDEIHNSQHALYTKYIKKKQEYRVHVFDGTVIDVQQKVLRKTNPITGESIDPSDVDFRVRNFENGFIFQRQNISPPPEVMNQASWACQAIGLDFGAVDVIYNESQKKAYVLEINTAPGLEGSTIDSYVNAIQEYVDQGST